MATETPPVDNIIADEGILKVEPPKAKNQKRVEQGKRLAEWNKQNKRPKMKLQNDSPASMQTASVQPAHVQPAPVQSTPVQSAPVHTHKKDNTNYWVLGGVIIFGGIAVGLIYFTQRGETIQPVQAPEAPIQTAKIPAQVPKQGDPFDMA